MKTTRVVCDRCLAHVTEGMSCVDINVTAGHIARHLYKTIDLCESCGRNLLNWLEEPSGKESKPCLTEST